MSEKTIQINFSLQWLSYTYNAEFTEYWHTIKLKWFTKKTNLRLLNKCHFCFATKVILEVSIIWGKYLSSTIFLNFILPEFWRRECLSTPIFLPGESHGQRSLTGYNFRASLVAQTAKSQIQLRDQHFHKVLLPILLLKLFHFWNSVKLTPAHQIYLGFSLPQI